MSPTKTVNEAAKTTRVADPELQALDKIGKLLAPLTEEVRSRVLRYVNEKYGPNRDVNAAGDSNA